MRKAKIFLVLIIIIMMLPLMLSCGGGGGGDNKKPNPTRNPLVGKWGYAIVEHGSWTSSLGTITFDSDGTGTDSYKTNDEGFLTSRTKNFTYSTTANTDGSLTLTVTYADGRTDTSKIIPSDNGNMFIVDGTADPNEQLMIVGIKMDTSKIYTNADLNGAMYYMGYEYKVPSNYESWSGSDSCNNGTCTGTVTENTNGILNTSPSTGTYTINPDGTIGNSWGYLSADDKLTVVSKAAVITDEWGLGFWMKKGDKTYSTADLAGTWVVVGFGDDNGNSFNAEIGTKTCNSSGTCTGTSKNQRDGNVKYESGSHTLSVSPDGSFGSSIATGAPSYAGAIGNNGNTMIFNASFDTTSLYHREIFIGVRCNNCYNLSGQMIPMIAINPNQNGNGINIYLYDPVSKNMNTVKNNTYSSWVPSVNTSQTKMVYTEGTARIPDTIKVYDISSKTSTTINTATARWSAYFNKDGKILFVDSNDRKLKRMNPDGSNITTIATPESPYTFDAFYMSSDREKIVIFEERQEGIDRYTGHYSRMVLMNADGTGRTILKAEYLGDWNLISWKPDSSGFLYYYHVFNVVDGVYQSETPKYIVINVDGSTTDLSNSYMAKEENVCFYTKSGNLLSLSYQELYNAQTGSLIKSRPDVPLWTNARISFDSNSEIYFSNLDGTNFRRFVE